MVLLPSDVEELQEMLVRMHLLERREPGGRRWPFAGDAPWYLMRRNPVDDMPDMAEHSLTLLVSLSGQQLEVRKVTSRQPLAPLCVSEVDELARLRQWLLMVPDAVSRPGRPDLPHGHDRKLVWLATAHLARGDVDHYGAVPWGDVRRELASPRTAVALAQRYRMALAVVVCRLRAWPERRARTLAGLARVA